MILGASRWLEPNAPTAARRPVAIAATRARIRTAGLRIAHSLLEIGVEQFCARGLRADVKLPARGSQQGSSVRLMLMTETGDVAARAGRRRDRRDRGAARDPAPAADFGDALTPAKVQAMNGGGGYYTTLRPAPIPIDPRWNPAVARDPVGHRLDNQREALSPFAFGEWAMWGRDDPAFRRQPRRARQRRGYRRCPTRRAPAQRRRCGCGTWSLLRAVAVAVGAADGTSANSAWPPTRPPTSA